MTYMELRHAIIDLLNKADNLRPEEIYGVVSTVEAEVRFAMLGTFRQKQPEQKEQP